MKTRLFATPVLTFFFAFGAQADSIWEGPAQSPGAGLGTLAKPTNYIDATGMGTWGDSSYNDSRFRMNYVLSESATDTWQLNAHAERFRFNESIPVVSSPDSFSAQNLWNLGIGGTYGHKLDSGGEWGVIAGLGSNSDQVFNSIHETSISLTGTWRNPVDATHSWLYFLSYANDRAFAPNVPFPGVSYLVIDPANHLLISYGLPFFFAWKPNDDWSYRIVYFIPTIINAEIAYSLTSRVKAHVGFDWFPLAWSPANRSDTKDQIILDQKKASFGLRASIASDWFLDVTGGYAFDQKLFEAEQLFATGINKNYLTASAFLQSDLALKF